MIVICLFVLLCFTEYSLFFVDPSFHFKLREVPERSLGESYAQQGVYREATSNFRWPGGSWHRSTERSGGPEEVRSLDGKAVQCRDIKMGGYGSDLDFST